MEVKKIFSAFGLSFFNFLLSIIGVFISIKYISVEQWSSLGLVLALLPLTSVFLFLMRHQSLLVTVKGHAVDYLNVVYLKLLPIACFTVLPVFFIFYITLQENISLILFSFFLSVILGFRLIQKYALTLDSKPIELYISNVISLLIWISSLLVSTLYTEITSTYRIALNFMGELFAFLYLQRAFSNNQSNKMPKSESSTKFDLNFIRIVIRQINYNSPVYLVNYFFGGNISAQIGLLSRVRVVVDQIINTLVVTFSRNIMAATPKELLKVSIIIILPTYLILELGKFSLFILNGAMFDEALVYWFFSLVVIWCMSIFWTLKLESDNKIILLFFSEVMMSLFISISFVLSVYFFGFK